jgi:hypothetical protein
MDGSGIAARTFSVLPLFPLGTGGMKARAPLLPALLPFESFRLSDAESAN